MFCFLKGSNLVLQGECFPREYLDLQGGCLAWEYPDLQGNTQGVFIVDVTRKQRVINSQSKRDQLSMTRSPLSLFFLGNWTVKNLHSSLFEWEN